jgi:C-terminal processing protease CtpA/Prc
VKISKYLIYIAILLVLVTTGCKKDPEPEKETEREMAPPLTRKINQFVLDVMSDVYLWYKHLPTIDINYEFETKEYFKKLLYEEDKWSFISDNIKEVEDSYQGIEKTYGYSLTYGEFSNSPGNYFGIVEYVYPNTPASRAGFKRGDIILNIAGNSITQDNYRELTRGTAITLTKGELTQSGIAPGNTVSMTAEELNLNPVHTYKVIEHAGHKIGYLFYTQFIARYNDSLKVALQYFQNENISDLILDFRYNPGGQTTAAQYLCSSVAPLSEVNSQKPLVTYQWNDKYQSYWQSRNNQSQLVVPFISNVPVKLGLNKIHILTGRGTASASELAIIGLEPYMSNITTIGETTYGKYTASITLKPEDMYKNSQGEQYYKDFDNWGIQPIVIRFANSQGITNFKNGFEPTYRVRDEMLPALPLGDLSEPLLRKAVEDITGSTITARKSAFIVPEYRIVDREFSRFDIYKRNLPINDILEAQGLNLPDLFNQL